MPQLASITDGVLTDAEKCKCSNGLPFLESKAFLPQLRDLLQKGPFFNYYVCRGIPNLTQKRKVSVVADYA